MDYERFNDRQIFNILSRFGSPERIKVLYVSTYYVPGYVRTEAILNILKRNKIHVRLIFTGSKILRYLRAVFEGVSKLRECDVLFLAFRGHEILPFFRLLSRKPIIFDAFVSAYDTLCFDRRIFRPDSIAGKILKCYDTYLCRIANLVLVDTRTHGEYFASEFKAKNVCHLYLEPNRDLFKPAEREKKKGKFTVFWYGKYWPLQGAEVIIKAAKILESRPEIVFRLVGPLKKEYKNLAANLNSANIEFIDYVPYESLPSEIAKADLCLGGHFSDIPKAKRVIPGKAFQFIACSRKTILGDNPANRELFSESEDIYFVKMNSEQELAKIIFEIKHKETAV